MRRPTAMCVLTTLWAAAAIACGDAQPVRSTRYEDLTALFAEWRAFQQPPLVDGVPDYTAGAMSQQRRKLVAYQQRLAEIDPHGWPIDRQVDYHVVRAEMNGLEFDHRVLQPWTNNPAFYVTVFTSESDQPARVGWTGSLALPVAVVRRGCGGDRVAPAHRSRAPRPGPSESHGQPARPLDCRR